MKEIKQKNLDEMIIKYKETKSESILEELYNNYSKLIYKIAFSILKNKEDSEDIVQKVFIKIFNMPKEQLPINNSTSWLYTVTKNEAISLIRSKKKSINIENIYEIVEDNNPTDNIIEKEDFNKLISNLNENEKEIVSLKIISNLSFKEIAKLVNEPISTVKWRYYKSIYKLKIIIGNLGMFIIAFVIGIKTLFKTEKIKMQEARDENILDNQNTLLNNEIKSIIQDVRENNQNSDDINLDNEVTNTSTIQPDNINVKINPLGVTFICISIFFLITTTIFFIKNQLKLKKKTSK